ncbi:MAG: hypothetical protein IKS85_07565 [Lachnospiraceae bacterium]|nr:hypothetical protein [Lachnospiraceae bacterium]
MKEVFRSSDVTALLLNKQFLAENDIPSRILLDGADITEIPINPRSGAVFHFDHDAILVVDDEDEAAARDFLDNVEIPADAEIPIQNRFGQTGEDLERMRKNVMRWIARVLILFVIGVVIYLIIRY